MKNYKDLTMNKYDLDAICQKIEDIAETQNIIMMQNLFIMDYLMGNDDKREELKQNLVEAEHKE